MEVLHNRILDDSKTLNPSLRADLRTATRSLGADPLCFNGSKRRGLVSLETAMEVRLRRHAHACVGHCPSRVLAVSVAAQPGNATTNGHGASSR